MREGFALNIWGLPLTNAADFVKSLGPAVPFVLFALGLLVNVPKVLARRGEDGSPERALFVREFPTKLTLISLLFLFWGSFNAFVGAGYWALIGAMIPSGYALGMLISKSPRFFTRKAVLLAYLIIPVALLTGLLDHIPGSK